MTMSVKNMFVILLVLGLSFAGLSVTDWTVSKDTFGIGEPGVVTVTVANPTGSEQVSGVTMSVDMPYELTLTGSPSLSDINAGGSAIVSVPFRVKSDAQPGIYLIRLVFKGYTSEASGFSSYTENSVSIPITVVNEPILSISTDKQVLGGIDDLVLTVVNNGGPATNVKLKIVDSSNVAFYSVDQVFIQRVSDSASINVTLDSRSASDGAANIPFTLEYDDELGITHTDDTTLRMTVRNEKLDLTFNQLSDVITRKEGTLTLQVLNNGPVMLKDVRLSFEGTGIRLKDHDELRFGDLQPGGTATASAMVFADTSPGLNSVNSTITWIEKDIQREESRTVPITITSDADVGVFLEARPAPLTLGTQHTISVLVSNLGSYRIDNVDASLSSPAMRSLDIADTQYIGGLQNDDFSTVQFLMEINATSPGDYPVTIKVNYRDQSGEWKQKSMEQVITVYGPVVQSDNTLGLLIVAVLLGVAVWYFRFRKR